MTAQQIENIQRVNRRQLFGTAASGVGMAALAKLVGPSSAFGTVSEGTRGSPGLPGLPHHPPKAKRVVVLWQGGGPSHVDLFDDKHPFYQTACLPLGEIMPKSGRPKYVKPI